MRIHGIAYFLTNRLDLVSCRDGCAVPLSLKTRGLRWVRSLSSHTVGIRTSPSTPTNSWFYKWEFMMIFAIGRYVLLISVMSLSISTCKPSLKPTLEAFAQGSRYERKKKKLQISFSCLRPPPPLLTAYTYVAATYYYIIILLYYYINLSAFLACVLELIILISFFLLL